MIAAAMVLLAAAELPRPAGTSIVVAGQPFDVGRPVVLWNDPERGFDGYAERCLEENPPTPSPCCASYQPHYRARPAAQRTLPELQKQIRQLVIHHDGCANSRSCFFYMHDGCRKLSTHFMIDSDGTIYQTLDVADIAYHARLVNDISVGIEMCNLASVDQPGLPDEYTRRPRRTVRIKGQVMSAFDFRPEQYDSVQALARTLLQVFPRIPPRIPLDDDQQPHLAALADPRAFAGIAGHLHVDDQQGKWDPGAFRWLDFLDALTGVHLPLEIDGFQRFVGADPAHNLRVAQAAFLNAERRASAQFPVQTGGLWHAGVNLRGARGAPVLAPYQGTVRAARLARHGDSSTSFVLIRHDVTAGPTPFTFYSLLYHLAPEALDQPAAVPWLRRLAERAHHDERAALARGEIVTLADPVAAGETVGFLGRVHRGLEQGPELRFEIFSVAPPPDGGAFWQIVQATEDGPFARAPALTPLIPGDSPDPAGTAATATDPAAASRLQRRRAAQLKTQRQLAIHHVHPWGTRLGEDRYLASSALAALTEAERRQLYRNAVAPYRFLTPQTAGAAGIPGDQVVHAYHPITFLAWFAGNRAGQPSTWVPVALPPVGSPPRARRSPPTGRDALTTYLDPPRLPEPTPIYLRLVEVPVVPRRRQDIPLIAVPSLNRASED
jgi:N-acetylmuramoyl-L-alanine amidase